VKELDGLREALKADHQVGEIGSQEWEDAANLSILLAPHLLRVAEAADDYIGGKDLRIEPVLAALAALREAAGEGE